MTATQPLAWQDANERYLTLALACLRARLTGEDQEALSTELQQHRQQMSMPPALETLAQAFDLSDFERETLLLAAAPELDSSFVSLLVQLQDDPLKPYPTFSLARSKLPGADWTALTPAAPLRRWRLLEANGPSLTQGALRPDERVLHYLAGVSALDERLQGFLSSVTPPKHLPPSQKAVAKDLIQVWAEDPAALVQLWTAPGGTPRAIAAHAAEQRKMQLWRASAQALPTTPDDQEIFLRLWEREARLGQGALLIEAEDGSDGLTWLLERASFPLVLVATERPRLNRPVLPLDVPPLPATEQHDLWLAALPQNTELGPTVERLVAQFNLSPEAIEQVAERAGQSPDDQTLWQASRAQARTQMDGLAQRIQSGAGWPDLVLPAPERQTLQEIALQVRLRYRVYGEWGFARKGPRGLGITALFAGGSGTGKTLAAEVLANELKLDLYRIDLSSVVSKYIGETEKNLRKVFDAAETGGAILLFDEADALFGKRSEVKDSHDRYANLEVSYLLQRMEQYRGLAILTTNMKDALDPAFLRRLRFVITFPFPSAQEREQIWRQILPEGSKETKETPTEGLEYGTLARLNLPGGNIRNIALYAAFLAAHEGVPVRMGHLLRAAQVEYAKLERPLTATELGGWE